MTLIDSLRILQEGTQTDDFWLWPYLAPLFLATFVYFLALYKKDNGLVDMYWSLLFLCQNFTLIFMKHDAWNPRSILVMTIVTIWAVRLSGYIFIRHGPVEDYRYKGFREKWERCSPTWGPIIIPIF
jgi:steroid 5-alpha reductase family enzyme